MFRFPFPRYDPSVPDRIDPWSVWCAAFDAYTSNSQRTLLRVLTTFPEDHKALLRQALGQEQDRLNAPPWDREVD